MVTVGSDDPKKATGVKNQPISRHPSAPGGHLGHRSRRSGLSLAIQFRMVFGVGNQWYEEQSGGVYSVAA